MNRLLDKRALITGGTAGIGLEAARLFLAEGARLAVTGTNTATLAAAQAELGEDVLTIRADAGQMPPAFWQRYPADKDCIEFYAGRLPTLAEVTPRIEARRRRRKR